MRIKARNKVMNLPLKRPELAAIPETSNDYDWMSFNKHQVEPPNQTIPEAAKMEPGEIPPDNWSFVFWSFVFFLQDKSPFLKMEYPNVTDQELKSVFPAVLWFRAPQVQERQN